MRLITAEWRKKGLRIALVPTMGALHEGHLSLVKMASEHADRVVVSLFVNPTQFGPGEDYEKYPRMLDRDLDLCSREGVSLVFAPDHAEMYGPGQETRRHFITFRIGKMKEHLCGVWRQGHFEGVLLVVNKLFHIVQPDVAVFGQKDIQQWYIIRQMALEHDHPVDILMGPTRREPDGLAQSSRNVYLNRDERKKAPLLYKALQKVRGHILRQLEQSPGNGQPVCIEKAIISQEINRLDENGLNVEYFSIVSAPDLQPVAEIMPGRQYIIAAAVQTGTTRLIDNVLLSHKES